MSQLPLGTTQQVFGSTYIYVDPQYINGLGMWRIYPGIPEAADITGLGAILPIVSTDLGPESVKVSFNIAGLPAGGIEAKPKAFNLLQQSTFSLPGMAPAGQTINTILPVNHVRAADKAVLYFDIAGLEKAEIVGTRDPAELLTFRSQILCQTSCYFLLTFSGLLSSRRSNLRAPG